MITPEYREVEKPTGKGYEVAITGRNGYKIWYKDGIVHREGAPASVNYSANGDVKLEIWLIEGERHREDGPALTEYTKEGDVDYHIWYLNGRHLKKEDFTTYEMIKKMKAESLFTLKELLVLKRNPT